MKRLLIFAALVLGLASCQREPEGLDINVGGAVDTEITVSLPDMSTRAGGSNSATSDIDDILADDAYTMRYMLQVFYGDKPSELYVRYSDNQSVSFPVRLVPGEGRNYNFVVWADIVAESANLEDDVKCADLHYEIGADLREISVIDNKWVAMDETRDAFTAVKLVENYNGSQVINIDLYRPFAKLRVITTDMVELTKHGITPTKATVTYKTKHRVAYNALTGEAAAASATKEHSYTIAAYGDNNSSNCVLLTDYFFAEESDLVKFDIVVKDQNDKEIVTRSFNTDINVKPNYLTTLRGNILTNGTDVNVTVKPDMGGENEWPNTPAGELAKAAMLGGEVTLTEDVVLEESLNVTSNMVINLNGHTITGPSEARDANGNRIHTIVNNGDLTVNGGTIESVAENGGSAICNNAGANLTINNVEINGAPLVDGGWPSYGINNYGTMTINGAKVNTYHGGIATGGNGIAVIEDATVDVGLNTQTKQTSWALYVFDNGQMTVNGGTFKNTKNENGQVYGGGYICAISTSKTIINGGTFDKTEGDNNGTGLYYQCKNLEIKGGVFDTNPSAYVADGYYVNVVDGKYEVNDFILTADTAGLQAALDAATDGTTIHLTAGVNYGVVYMGRPTKSNNTTMICNTHNFETTDEAAFAAHLNDGAYHTTPKYITTLKNLTIVGAQGATIAGLLATSGHTYGDNIHDYVLGVDKSGSVYYHTLHMENIKFSNVAFTGKIDINTSDAESTYNGITFEDCTFTTGGTASDNGAAIRYYNEANNGKVKNITVKNCKFNNCNQGVYVHHVNGITAIDNEFNTTGHNAIAMQGHDGEVDLKAVVIKNNTFENIGDRIIRFNNVGADSQITIQYNTATNSGDDAGEVIKATSIAAGVTTDICFNNWGGGVVVNPELKDYKQMITPSDLATIAIESNTEYYLNGDFANSNVSLVMAVGVENVIFDGTNATNINELIITQNGSLIDNANTPIGERSGMVTVQNFNVLSQINVFACKTTVVVEKNSAEALMIYAGNCNVKVLNNTIDANFESHPTYRDANRTWNPNDYGIALNIFDYNLWLDGNTVTDAVGHAIGINGWEGTIDNGDENKIESFKNNNITVNSTAKTKRAAFKVWDDETYASNDDDTNAVNPTAQAFINAVLADGSNTFNIISGYDHTIFSFYNVNTNN